ncbi:dTDP-4-dehydrorhamnose 3,5-epimerase family protein [Candidatus Microgenomates bacterium]|nr:dTDP-4-dehydrorhamnose 3,5-epimerase family protein [Candidatus Microgenomates bacterium]
MIDGVRLRQLVVHRDERGMLAETLREDWHDVFQKPQLQFNQSYYSVTNPGFARDKDQWHVHPKQVDRFVVIKGKAVVALYDAREDSKTYQTLNLFLMGEGNGDNNQYLLLIPQRVLHAFCVVGNEPCYLINYPSQIYNPQEEGRIPFTEACVCFSDNTPFSWDIIRQQF